MSTSDEDDLLNYTPLQRSQVFTKESKPNLKPSKLSLSFRKSQSTDVKTEAKTTPSKSSSKTSRAVKKKTPVKSRADHPEENCSDFQLAKWKFLYGSQDSKIDKKPELLKRKIDLGGESSRDTFTFPQQKRKSVSEECVPESKPKKEDELVCVHCKFPFNSVNEHSLHSFLCGSKDLSHMPKCPAGSKCSETTEQHFWGFDHNEKSPDTDSLCTAMKTNTEVQMDPNNSHTSDSRCNGIGGPSRSGEPSPASLFYESSEIIVLSDDEESAPSHKQGSMPLFELEEREDSKVKRENEDHKVHPDKESISHEDSHQSSNLLDSPIIPDIELFEDGESTVCFDDQNDATASSFIKEQKGQENQKSPKSHIQDDNSGSETPDLFIRETQPDELDDPEGDELIANLAEEAIDQFAMPALEKVMKWRRDCKKVNTETPAAQNSQNSESNNVVVQPLCIHLHYHEASPAPSPSTESGQTSILTYFKPTKYKEEKCPCGEKKTFTRQENVAAWQGLMGRMQKRNLVSLPSVSQNSSSEQGSGGSKPRWRRKDAAEPKTCPFYKYIPDTSIVVDAFSYGSVDGVTAYFLSHFHYDHYRGLRKDFSHPIYCSEITARLVNSKLRVPSQYLNPLPMWEPQQVCGVEVTLLDANHCPGAVMFLFKVKPGVTHLHVGDFRAHPSMENYSALHCSINTLFLDTTYCSPEYVFPTQERMIEKCVSLAQDHHQRNSKTLFVVGSYTIGKEKVFRAIASSLNCSIWVRHDKKQVLNCINDEEIQARLTDCNTNAKLHVLPMTEVRGLKLKDYLKRLRPSFSEIVGMCPTGWEFTGVSSDEGLDSITSERPYPDVYIYGIPYSEHSSFSELKQFVQFIKPRKIIPTVNNGNHASRNRMQQHFTEWQTTKQLFS